MPSQTVRGFGACALRNAEAMETKKASVTVSVATRMSASIAEQTTAPSVVRANCNALHGAWRRVKPYTGPPKGGHYHVRIVVSGFSRTNKEHARENLPFDDAR